ncbi:MAG: 50S ribosomal protein L25 [Anaerolineae bacterium]
MAQTGQVELEVERRTVLGKKVKQLRDRGLIPAILYGCDTEPIPLQVERQPLRRALGQVGVNRLIILKIKGEEKPRLVLARDVEFDPISHNIRHVDFYQVVMTRKVKAQVGLTLVGESPLVAQGAGVLLRGLDTVEIECLPGDLIHSIEVDLSALKKQDDVIYVRDLKVPPNITILTDGRELVAKTAKVRVAAGVALAEKPEEAPKPEAVSHQPQAER